MGETLSWLSGDGIRAMLTASHRQFQVTRSVARITQCMRRFSCALLVIPRFLPRYCSLLIRPQPLGRIVLGKTIIGHPEFSYLALVWVFVAQD